MLKRRSILFQKSSKTDNISLWHPNLNINWLTVERESSMKIPEV